MAYDLKDEDGELDRDKVLAEMDRILGSQGTVGHPVREEMLELVARALNQAQVDAEKWSRY